VAEKASGGAEAGEAVAVSAQPLLTAKQAARMLKLSLGAFYQLRRRHQIHNSGIGRRLLFAREDLLRVRSTSTPARVIDFEALARQDARGERFSA
jgi:hypothetical protein